MKLKTGDVFTWDNYPNQRDGKIKRRWFLFLAEIKDNPLENDSTMITIIAPTATTQLQYYEENEERSCHPVVRFYESSSPFDKDCLFDFSMTPEACTRSFLEKFMDKGDIHVKGTLSSESLKGIYQKTCQSSTYSPRLCKQIKSSLNRAGIYGLPDPPSRGKR